MCQCVFLHFICFLAFPATLFLLFAYFILFWFHCLILAVCFLMRDERKVWIWVGGEVEKIW